MPAAAGFVMGALGVGAGTAFAAAGGAMFGGWVAGAAFGSTLLGAVGVKLLTSVALSALSTALMGKPEGQQAGMRTSSTMTGGTNPEAVILGAFATSGALVCPPMSHGWAGKTPNAYLTYVVELAGAPGHDLLDLMIDGEYVEVLTANPHATYGQRIGGRFEGRAWIRYYDGTQTTADAGLLATYPAPHVRPWTPDMVGHGICYAILTFQYDREVYHSWPSTRFVLGGMPLYDPRRDSTAGGSGPQRWDSPATWTATRNAAVMVYNILRGIRLPGGHVWGGEATAEDLPYATWAAAMDVCDQQVDDGAGGTEPQYRAGIEVFAEDEPFAVVDELLSACAGHLTEHGGVWQLRCGAPGMPVLFFSDDDVIITDPQEFDPFPAPDATYNAITASYPDPESLWESRDAEPIYNEDWEAEDGGRRLPVDLPLTAVPWGAQVTRIMSALIRDHRRMRRHIITLPPEAGVVEPGDVIAWTSEANFYSAKLFEIAETVRDPRTGLVQVSLREVDPADYDPPSDLTRPAPPDVRPVRPDAQTVPFWSVEGLALEDMEGAPRRSAIRASWDPEAADDARGVRVQVRRSGDAASMIELPLSDVAAGEAVWSSAIPGEVYEARGRIVAERPTAWTDWMSAVAPDVAPIEIEDLPPDLIDRLDDARQTADAAAEAAQDALDTAQGAITHADTIVQQAREDLAVDYQAAEDAVTGALAAAQQSGEYASEARDDRLAAETARGLAEGYRNESYQSATNAGESAALAQRSEGIAVQATNDARMVLARTFPRDFSAGGAAWSHSFTGAPESKADLGAPVEFQDHPSWGRVARLDAPITGNRHIAPKAYLPNTAGRRYRMTVEAVHVGGFAGGSQSAVMLRAIQVSGSYGSAGTIANATLTFPAPGVPTAQSLEFDAPGGVNPWIMPFTFVPSAEFGSAGASILFRSIVIEDVTESHAAANSASAAYDSEQTAGSHADDAGSSAYAADQSRLEAQAAADDAGDNATQAGVYRNDAVTAAQNAEDAAASAESNVLLTAEVAGRGISCLSDTFLLSSDWGRWAGNGTRTLLPNAIYPIGRTWQFGVTDTQRDGIQLIDSPETIWKGQTNARAYVIEVEYTMVSGPLQGTGVQLAWRNSTNTSFNVRMPLADMQAGAGVPGRARLARGVFVRPANFSGTFASHRLHVFANFEAWDMAAKTIQFHRVNIRPATDEEVGSGQVLAGVSGWVHQNFFTRAETDQAIATADLTVNASFNGVKATAEQASTAIAGINGSVVRARNMVTVDGVNYAGLEAVAFDGAGTGTGTATMLYGDQVIVPKSLSAAEVVVHDGSGNLFPDPQFIGLSVAGWRRVNGQPSYAGPVLTTDLPAGVIRTNAPAPAVFRFTNHAGQGHFVLYGPTVEASAGNVFALGFDYAVGPANHVLQLRLGWIDNTGAVFARAALTANTAPALWQRFATDVEAPAGTVAAQIEIVSLDNGTMTSWSAATNFTVIRKRDGETLITPNSITTREVLTGSLHAEDVGAGRFSAHMLSVDGLLTIEESAGLRYQKNGVNSDETDGIYFGHDGGRFGLSATRTSDGIRQSLKLSQDSGFEILNARHFVSGATLPVSDKRTTNLPRTPLPPGARVSMELVGGGGGGASAGRGDITSTPGGAGGDTIVRLYDGTTLKHTFTAQGGAGGAGNATTLDGQNSDWSEGGRGNGGSGGGQWWSGGKGYLLGQGGRAGKYLSPNTVDTTGWADPQIEITIGAGGLRAAPSGLGHGFGQNGIGGAVNYSYDVAREIPASVLPLVPSAAGSFVKGNNATGNEVFPDLGPGMWHIFSGDGDLEIGTVTIASTGNQTIIRQTQNTTFIADIRPNITAGRGGERTVYYRFYRMGDWG